MAVRLVTYDIADGDSDDYEELHDAIKEYEHHHLQKSVWLIDTSESSKAVFDTLKAHLSDDDDLFVVRLRKGWWSTKGRKWLKSDERTW